MHDTFSAGAAFAAQVLTSHPSAGAGQERSPAVLHEVLQFLEDIWAELAVVFVCASLLIGRRFLGGRHGDDETPKLKCAAEVPTRSPAPARKSGATSQGAPARESTQRLVRRTVVAIIEGSSDPVPLYEELVANHHESLRQLVADDQARNMYVALVGQSLKSGKSRDCDAELQRALRDMRRFGFPRSLMFYALVMKLYTTHHQYASVLRLYEFMIADEVAPDRMMYICLLNAAVACDLPDKALDLFDQLRSLGAASVRSYMTILRVHAKRGDWAAATGLLGDMKAAGSEPDNLMLNHVLGLCVTADQVGAAEEAAEAWRPIMDVVSCNILLKGFTQHADIARAEALLERMETEGPPCNLISYNTVMDCSVRALQLLSSPGKRRDSRYGTTPSSPSHHRAHSFGAIARRPWELLDQIQARGIEPDRYTCSTLVKGMHLAGCSVTEIDRVAALLRHLGAPALQEGQGKADHSNTRLLEVLFNTLLDACVTAKDLDRMAEIFGLMRSFKASVSAVTFGTLIKAFGQAGKLGECSNVWEEMRKAGIRPTAVTYGCYIDACIRNDRLDQAIQVFEGMAADQVSPNAVIYTTIIRGFARARQPGKALAFYRAMREHGVEPTAVTFNSVLDIISRQLAEPEKLAEVIADMSAAQVAPDVVTYSILVKASCQAGDIDSALGLFEKLRQEGLVFDTVAFNTLLLACSKAGRLADCERIFDEMCALGMRPTHVTISILVKMYGRAKMLSSAIAVADRMEKEYGETPNLHVYTCLIQACAQNGQVRKSWDVFNHMLASGIEPDAITYGAMVHGCIYLSSFEPAMCLVRQAYAKACPPGAEESPFDQPPVEGCTPVPLQAEVLSTLLACLRRRRQSGLARELEEIMAEHGVAPVAV